MLFTIRDPDGMAPVYNDVVNELRINGILSSEITLRTPVREKLRGVNT